MAAKAGEWKPAPVIDASTLIAVVARGKPMQEWNFGIEPGEPLGTLMKMQVLQTIDGEPPADPSIVFFQPAGGVHGYQFLSAPKFILFLREMSPTERELFLKVKATYKRHQDLLSQAYNKVWTLATGPNQWASYCPTQVPKGVVLRGRTVDGRVPLLESPDDSPSEVALDSRLLRQLQTVGVGDQKSPLDYITRLVALRRRPPEERQKADNLEDPFLKEVAGP